MKHVQVNGHFTIHQTVDVSFDAIKQAYRKNATTDDVIKLLAFKIREELSGDGESRLVKDGNNGQGYKYEEYINNGGHYDGYYFLKNASDKEVEIEDTFRKLRDFYQQYKDVDSQ